MVYLFLALYSVHPWLMRWLNIVGLSGKATPFIRCGLPDAHCLAGIINWRRSGKASGHSLISWENCLFSGPLHRCFSLRYKSSWLSQRVDSQPAQMMTTGRKSHPTFLLSVSPWQGTHRGGGSLLFSLALCYDFSMETGSGRGGNKDVWNSERYQISIIKCLVTQQEEGGKGEDRHKAVPFLYLFPVPRSPSQGPWTG